MQYPIIRRKLTLEWVALAGLYATMTAFFFLGLISVQRSSPGWLWLPVTTALLAYELSLLYRGLPSNHRPGESEILESLGAGTWLTMLRGLFLAMLGGFLLLPRPEGWLSWVPGLLYLCAGVADYLDGYVARVTHHSTALGQQLDMDLDALGILIAPLLGVLYGQLPMWYLTVSIARYLFLAGLWLLKRQGKSIYTLPESDTRRFLAGFQMGLCGVILLPIFTPPGTLIAATLFMIPFLSGFMRDWLVASGVVNTDSPRYKTLLSLNVELWYGWLPVALRIALPILWVIGVQSGALIKPVPVQIFLEGAMLAALVTGFVGRLAALVFLLALGFAIRGMPLDMLTTVLIICSSAILLLGSGKFASWTPDETFLRRRAGQTQTAHS